MVYLCSTDINDRFFQYLKSIVLNELLIDVFVARSLIGNLRIVSLFIAVRDKFQKNAHNKGAGANSELHKMTNTEIPHCSTVRPLGYRPNP